MDVSNLPASSTLAEAITEQPAAEGTTPEPPKPDAPKEEPLSARFAALARKQKAMDQEKQRLKQEKNGFDAEKSEYLKWKEEQSKPKAKKTPLEALMAEGYSYEDASNFVMNDNRITPELKIKEFESKLERMEREAQEKEQAKLESEKQSQEAAQAKAIEEFKVSIINFVTSNAETYELIGLHEAQDLIYDTISAHYEQTKEEGKPVILSTKEAADMVEAYLEEQVEKSINTKKLKAKLKPSDETAVENKAPFSSKTLNNSTTSTTPAPKTLAKTDDERIKRALAHLGS